MKLKKKAAKAVYSITVTQREYDAIIAALRLYQAGPDAHRSRWNDIADSASEHGERLDGKEVDKLIQFMQFGENAR